MTTADAGGVAPLWASGFGRLVAVRLCSQAGDGVFAAGVAFLVLLSPGAQRTPGAYAGVLALLLLPFCVVGPFASSVLDRWRRRQVLVLGELGRAALGVAVAALAVVGDRGATSYALVLVVLGVNRLLLAALSAAVPHVVAPARLVDANALGPTAGTVATGVGAAAGAAVAAATQASVTVLAAVALWAVAALVARGFAAGALGPEADRPTPTLRETATDLVTAARHVASTPAGPALLRFGLLRLVVGVFTLAALVAVGDDGPEAALVAVSTGAGFGLGAVLTPLAARLVPVARWVAATAALAVLLAAASPVLTSPWSWAAAGLGLGLLGQSLKIWTDTLVQRHVDEQVLGRAFTLYDLVYNASFVAGALLALAVV